MTEFTSKRTFFLQVLTICIWNSASLFGTLLSASRYGGLFLALDKRVADMATEIRFAVHVAGRAMTLSVFACGWIHFTLVHVDPSTLSSTRRRLFTQNSAFHADLQGPKFMLGDWNFIHSGDSRPTGAGDERHDTDQLVAAFERAFPEYTELFQLECTFRRLLRRDTSKCIFSRIDRIYTSLHPLALEGMWKVVGVVGGILDERHPSDHRAVTARLRRLPPRRRRPRLQEHTPSHSRFSDFLAEEIDYMRHVTDHAVFLEGAAVAAYRAQTRIRRLPPQRAGITSRAMSETSIAAIRMARSGKTSTAFAMPADTPRLSEACVGNTIDVPRLLALHAELLHEVAAQDLRDIDRACEPKFHKNGRRQRVRRRLEPYRVVRKRLDLSGVYTEDGTLLETQGAVAAELLRQWQPVFERRPQRGDDIAYFSQFIAVDAELGHWERPRGEAQTLATRMPRSAPGPDGPPYSFWGQNCPTIAGHLDDLATSLSLGTLPPSSFTCSFTVFIPKGECEDDLHRVARMAAELRPLKLVQTSARLVAAVADRTLSTIAARTVCAQQRGFVQGSGCLTTSWSSKRGWLSSRRRLRTSLEVCSWTSRTRGSSMCFYACVAPRH